MQRNAIKNIYSFVEMLLILIFFNPHKHINKTIHDKIHLFLFIIANIKNAIFRMLKLKFIASNYDYRSTKTALDICIL